MNRIILHLCVAAFALLAPGVLETGVLAASERQAVEVGEVRWERNFQGALEKSRHSGRPLLVLFQEVPGCSGCRKFGREVLSHPVLVANMESEFIPVLVYNNRPGRDAETLQRYGEPAWNYQVIRFLDGSGRDVIPRRDHVWTVKGVAIRMVEALEARERMVPRSLRALTE
jgi:hypothetical protein